MSARTGTGTNAGDGTASSSILRWLLAPGDPLNLAVFRIAWFGGLLVVAQPWRFSRFADLPPELLRPPQGVPMALAEAALDPAVADAAALALSVAAVAALVGWRVRTAAAVVTVLGLYVYGLPQLFHKVDHVHHVIWVSALFAVCPSADVLSIDQWWRRRHGALSPPSPRPDLPRRAAWLLLGMIYFFPGLWKALRGGPSWAFGDNVRNQLWAKWTELGGYLPPIRIDEIPLLYQAVGVAVIAFELLFLFGMLSDRWRGRFALVGLTFHLSTLVLMQIGFPTLWPLYAAIPDWRRWVARLSGRRPTAAESRVSAPVGPGATPHPSPTAVVRTPQVALICALLGAVALAGALRLGSAWPVASYPDFSTLARAHVTKVELVEAEPTGVVSTVPGFESGRSVMRSARFKRMTEAAFSIDDSTERLAYARALVGSVGVTPSDELVLRLVEHPADPDRWDEPARVVAELHLGDGAMTVFDVDGQ